MSLLTSLIPTTPGLLPKWQLLVSGMALFNCVQNFVTLKLTRRIYTRNHAEVTALQSRTFAVWTWTSAVVRIYCAYHIQEKTIYDITMWTYVGAVAHFLSEWLLFRSTDLGPGMAAPLIVAPLSLVWMSKQYDFYVTK